MVLMEILAASPKMVVKSADIIFFVVLAIIVGVSVLLYYLLPLLNEKQYAEMRENLRKREIAYNENLKTMKENQNKKE